ncbi:ABC-type multidrug transport system ATPase subunit [Curtobacterium flaccumfaciens]|uniref:ABC-type multidrug transport system ATPase subunit n=1 Tax=Curtobacterium flaccumfaciens TaxID=2035 RepID=A0A4V3BLE6_9MICO|nr:ABC-type multidrug transport system ATPase subunit [Curtobacterium flaccumfaciens]
MAAGADDDDVYATSDAAWLTEDDATAAREAADDDMGDGDALDASAEDAMTDDTTVTDHATDEADTTAGDTTAGETTAGYDTTGSDDPASAETPADEVETTPAGRAAPAAAASVSGRRPAKPRSGKGRATRPTQAAGTTGTVPPGPDAQDVPDVSPADDASSSRTVGESAADTAADTAAPKAKKRPASTKRPATTAKQPQQPVVLRASGLVKRYGQTLAVDEVDLEIRQGSIFGVVGPNGAGKTTTLSIVTGLLRPDAGSVTVLDHDVWADPTAAKRDLGVLPDRLRLFDRLTGAQLLYYSATLRGLDGATARKRSADLAEAFGLGEALGRQVADYSVGMAKKIALAATLIHSPRVLVLDEPFESVDPVSAATITEILRRYTRGGGTVVLSSHSMELVQRTCDSVAIIVGGRVLASGTMAQVRGRKSLEDKFVELAGGRVVAESMEWLHSFSG